MYCRNYTGTASHVLCREVYYYCVLIWESPLSKVPLNCVPRLTFFVVNMVKSSLW